MPDKNKKLLVILDAHAILHRAYHALPHFTSPKGEPTGALYGFTAMLLKIIRELKPDYLAAAYDLAEPTFRHIAYEKYKATRAKTDDELIPQFNRSKEILKAFHVPVYEEPGFEADDIIGTAVEKNKSVKDIDIMIASGDLDTLQLVSGDRVRVYTLKKGNEEAIYNEKEVEKRYGFGPELVPDYKGLVGDPSDNIPGIKGIGEKTAKDLICKFGPLETILDLAKNNSEKLKKSGTKERIVKLLADGEEEALFSKTLATIRRDAPIKFDFQKATWQNFNRSSLESIFRELGFISFLARIPGERPAENDGALDAEPEMRRKIEVAFWLLDSRRINVGYEEILKITGARDAEDVYKKLLAELENTRLGNLFKEIELPLIRVLDKMQKNGIAIDVKLLRGLSKKNDKELVRLTAKIHEIAGEKFNINSTKEMRRILFEKLGLDAKRIKKTGGGEKSTRFSELLKLKGLNPIVDAILKYRELAKLKSTYVDALPALAGTDGRIHTTFLQTGTATGRLASRDPNLQNIPIRTELGREVRAAFFAPKGKMILTADYSQIELRVAAILSGDEKMKKAFSEGKDIHAMTASEIFNVDAKDVTPEMRRRAKIINFGILYGMGKQALAENLGIGQDEAELYIQEYFKDFEGVKSYTRKVADKARDKGYVQTMFGRKRYLPEINSPAHFMQAEAERMAVNAPIQGTAADMIKTAMIRINDMTEKDPAMRGLAMLLQIHDELLFEVEKDIMEEAAAKIKKIMEGVLESDVPIKVELNAGPNWAELKKLDL
ncbi:MAG: DNA polymerase [Patescibacteria group bacterium]